MKLVSIIKRETTLSMLNESQDSNVDLVFVQTGYLMPVIKETNRVFQLFVYNQYNNEDPFLVIQKSVSRKVLPKANVLISFGQGNLQAFS